MFNASADGDQYSMSPSFHAWAARVFFSRVALERSRAVFDSRKPLSLAFGLALMLVFAGSLSAQTSDADEAYQLLEQGISQYQAFNYAQAKSTLLKVNASLLTDSDRATLSDYLNRVDLAIRRQEAAQQSFQDGLEALEDNRLEDARRGFADAAGSEFLPDAQREAAQEQLNLVEQRIAAGPVAQQEPEEPVLVEIPADDQQQDVTDVEVAQVDEPQDIAPPQEVVTPEEAPQEAIQEEVQEEVASETPPVIEEDPMARIELERAQARDLLAQARLEMQMEQYQTALTRLRQAQALAPDMPEIQQAMDEAEARVAERELAGEHLSDLARRIQRYKQAADINIEESLRRAREIVAIAGTGTEFDAAMSAINSAENILQENRQYYTPEELRQRDLRIGEVARQAERARSDWDRRMAEETRRAIAVQEAQRIATQEAEFQREIDRLTEQAQVLVRSRQYDQAIGVLDQIIRLEPNSRWAHEQKNLLEQIAILQRDRQAHSDRNDQTLRSLVGIRESEIPWYDLIRYPRDWRELTARREAVGGGLGSESEASRVLNNRLRTMVIDRVQFDNIGLQEVINWIQNYANINIHVKWPALEMASPPITTDTQVRGVNLTNVTVEKALKTILEDVGGGWTQLTYLVEDGVLTISTREDLSASRYRRTEVYDIRDLIVAVPDFAGPRIDLDAVSNIDSNGDSGGGGGLFGNDSNNDNDENESPSRAEIVGMITDLIQETIDPTSWRGDMGGDIGSIRHIHGQLVITQTPDNHREILELINKLREAQAVQISIETRFISVATGFLNSIGLDLQMYFNIGSQLGGGGSAVDPTTGAVVPIKGPNGWNNAGYNPPGGNSVSPIPVQQNTMGFTNMLGVSTPGTISSKIGEMVSEPSMRIMGTFLDDIQVDFLMEATQASHTTRSMTAPRLTLFNGQRAYVSVATQMAYVSKIEPVVSANVVAFRPTVSFVPTGAVMDVRGTVSADRRYVTLDVRPQLSQLVSFTNYSTVGEGAGGVGNLMLPTVSLQDLKTVVSVPDGGTLLLGGQRASGETEREKGVPLLSKVPIVNRAFTNRGMVRDEETILIMIKPKIIIQREEEDLAFPPGY